MKIYTLENVRDLQLFYSLFSPGRMTQSVLVYLRIMCICCCTKCGGVPQPSPPLYATTIDSCLSHCPMLLLLFPLVLCLSFIIMKKKNKNNTIFYLIYIILLGYPSVS